MRPKLISQRALLLLTSATILLLICALVTLGLGELLEATGDLPGALVLKYIALGCGALFVVALISLILAQTANSLVDNDGPSDQE